MARKPKGGGAVLPPHQPRPLLVAADQPADVRDLPYGLVLQVFGPAPGTCSDCGNPADRLTADGRLCPSCTDPWTVDDTPGRAS